MNKVLVIGSINMDLVVETDRAPSPGETLTGKQFATYHGGKGANQAVAACRLGAQVSMIGCVGQDAFGMALIDGLRQEGIDTQYVLTRNEAATGVAVITVSQAENAIIVVPGTNHLLSAEDIHNAEPAFANADVVLCQLEIPLETVQAAAKMAAQHGKPFLLNPAPAVPLPDSLLQHVTLLTPNEHELALIFNTTLHGWQDMISSQSGRVVVTRGSEGAWFSDAEGTLFHQPGFLVKAVDTTGAGDTFNGTLAAFWGEPLNATVRKACAAGAISVTRSGAQSGMPTLAELNAFLATQEQA